MKKLILIACIFFSLQSQAQISEFYKKPMNDLTNYVNSFASNFPSYKLVKIDTANNQWLRCIFYDSTTHYSIIMKLQNDYLDYNLEKGESPVFLCDNISIKGDFNLLNQFIKKNSIFPFDEVKVASIGAWHFETKELQYVYRRNSDPSKNAYWVLTTRKN